MPKPNPNAGKFIFERGVCTNPDIILHHDGADVKYKLFVSQCHAGWLAGYELHPAPGAIPLIQQCMVGNDLYFNRTAATTSIIEIVCNVFADYDFHICAHVLGGQDWEPLIKYAHIHGITHNFFINKKQLKMAKQIGAPGPKKTGNKKINIDPPGSNDTFEIMNGAINDGYCNYGYQMIGGKMNGFVHGVKGKGIVDDDMNTAFSKLNIHLAIIDDVFKHANRKITDINKMHGDELATLYTVTSFKIDGGIGNMAVVLSGNKFIGYGARMELKSPKIALDNLSSYKHWESLLNAVNDCRMEVALYHNGKFTVPSQPDTDDDGDESGATQLTIGDGADNKNDNA